MFPLILLGLGWAVQRYLKRWTLHITADRLTAEERLKKCPPGVPIANKPDALMLKPGDEDQLETLWGWYNRKNDKGKLYWTTVTPKDKSKIERVLVCFHGYADHSGFLQMNTMMTHAKLYNTAVVGFDMPSHGRSDGLHIYVEDWFEFVDAAVEFMDNWVQPQRQKWMEAAGRELKMFGQGESMGGGVLTTICLKHPKKFNGIVLGCPMLYISPKLLPPMWVQLIFKHVLVRLLPEWPIAPTKNIVSLAFTDKAMCEILRSNPLGSGGQKVRLRTAYSMGFVATPWLSERLADLNVPFLVIHGGEDKVTSPEYSQRLYDTAQVQDKKIVIYEGAEHADLLHGGPAVKALVTRVWADVGGWLKERS